MSNPLSLYESLDVIGNGSFGIIRKVRRKADNLVFARKELNFERMTERDRKQIVSEVNILKELHHEHIVRYHDRFIDREAGILYILMEYCGGGDLSTVIKQAQRYQRPIPEDTVWNYFMQILLALNHCHHPQGQSRTSTGGTPIFDDGERRRPQILHRDLKPDNVFLDENNTVKLGDFGLSKALAQASFANTYVGTPYYMSPELMQEKAYDSKSDIWSLGCLIYELCALKPPFHEAKTHAELSILIRNGRIPPLPKGYSTTLSTVIKAMLNLNPAMRPSAAQLLQHERLDLAFKVTETQKMLTAVKTHKANLSARERDVVTRETALKTREATLLEQESQLKVTLSQKDAEIASLKSLLTSAEATHQTRMREAIMRREEELRQMVLKQEAEVAMRMARREDEIMDAVRKREEEIAVMWAAWEKEIREGMTKAMDENMEWVKQRGEEIEQERQRLEGASLELERRMAEVENMDRRKVDGQATAKTKTPLEEVKNILAPLARLAEQSSDDDCEETPRVTKVSTLPPFATPVQRHVPKASRDFMVPGSAMKGVVLTATGETLATPSPAEFAKLFVATPKVSLNFAQIFEFDSEAESTDGEDEALTRASSCSRASTISSSASMGKMTSGRSSSSSTESKTRKQAKGDEAKEEEDETTPKRAPRGITRTQSTNSALAAPAPVASRLRRPSIASIRSSSSQTSLRVPSPMPSPPYSATQPQKPKSRPPSRAGTSSANVASGSQQPVTFTKDRPAPEYDLSDEENLPSPFLKKIDRDRIARTASAPISALAITSVAPTAENPATTSAKKTVSRKSGHTLRAVAALNAAHAVTNPTTKTSSTKVISRTASSGGVGGSVSTRLSAIRTRGSVRT